MNKFLDTIYLNTIIIDYRIVFGIIVASMVVIALFKPVIVKRLLDLVARTTMTRDDQNVNTCMDIRQAINLMIHEAFQKNEINLVAGGHISYMPSDK